MTGLPSLIVLVVAIAVGGAFLLFVYTAKLRSDVRAAYILRSTAYDRLAQARAHGGDVGAAQKEVAIAEEVVRITEERLPRRRRRS